MYYQQITTQLCKLGIRLSLTLSLTVIQCTKHWSPTGSSWGSTTTGGPQGKLILEFYRAVCHFNLNNTGFPQVVLLEGITYIFIDMQMISIFIYEQSQMSWCMLSHTGKDIQESSFCEAEWGCEVYDH